jgi:hypothetical protein
MPYWLEILIAVLLKLWERKWRTQPITLDELRTEIDFFSGKRVVWFHDRENLEFPLRRHTKKFGILKDTTALVKEALEM